MSTVTIPSHPDTVAGAQPLTETHGGSVACGASRTWLNRLLEQIVLGRLSSIQDGQIFVDDACRRHVVGSAAADGLNATVVVNDHGFYRKLAAGGSLGAAEAYLDGDWDCDDLTSFFRVCCRNLDQIRSSEKGFNLLTHAASLFAHWFARNTREGSRRNIHAHYDLGNEFFELFLDPTMMYSSAIFEKPDMSLHEAQVARLDQICRRLKLSSSDHLLEIGTGWGGLAHHAAAGYGCRVTTTTISEQQYEYACRRIADAGLQDRVTVLKQDYRDLTGQYDKLVSLEMIEAVGHQFHDQYFSKCAGLLRSGGLMLLQAITMPEQRYAHYLKSVDFIQKYIFPGGCLPSVTAMQDAVTRNSDMRLLELQDFADGYARTLREWRRRFVDRLDEVRQLGYSDRFIRMWDYYLCYCEAAFEERSVSVVQAMWGR
jgi:cyclopropane-fatty-acyl-phospholipid synthase